MLVMRINVSNIAFLLSLLAASIHGEKNEYCEIENRVSTLFFSVCPAEELLMERNHYKEHFAQIPYCEALSDSWYPSLNRSDQKSIWQDSPSLYLAKVTPINRETSVKILSPDQFKSQILELHKNHEVPNLKKKNMADDQGQAELKGIQLDESDRVNSIQESENDTKEGCLDVETKCANSHSVLPEVNLTLEVNATDDEEDEEGTRFNYASLDAGAIIMANSNEFKSTSNLLIEDRDKYSLAPCNFKKWVVIGLSEDILVDSIVIANYERYSSTVKEFQVLASHHYPVNEWYVLGKFEASPDFGEQTFHIPQKIWARYLKIRITSHYGNEFYCTLSLIRVYGSTHIESIRQEIEETSKSIEKIKGMAEKSSIMANSSDPENSELETKNISIDTPNRKDEENVKVTHETETKISTENEKTNNHSLIMETVRLNGDQIPTSNVEVEKSFAMSHKPVEEHSSNRTKDYNTTIQSNRKGHNTISGTIHVAENYVHETQGKNLGITIADTGMTIKATNRLSSATQFLSGIHLSKISSCPDGYQMASDNMNGNITTSFAFLCAKFTNNTEETHHSSKQIGEVVSAIRVMYNLSCPENYLTAGVIFSGNISICYMREESSTGRIFQYLTTRTKRSHTSPCVNIPQLGLFICTERSSDGFDFQQNKIHDLIQEENDSNIPESKTSFGKPRTPDFTGTRYDSDSNLYRNQGLAPSLKEIGGNIGASMESIFKTLTSKVLQVELDQSLLKQYVENLAETYSKILNEFHRKLDNSLEERAQLASKLNELMEYENGLKEFEKNLSMRVASLEEELELIRVRYIECRNYVGDLAVLTSIALVATWTAICFFSLRVVRLEPTCK